jgi:hypothetical protein
MTENSVEKEVLRFMQGLGWVAQRNHVGKFKTPYGATVSIGTPGYPDWSFTRGKIIPGVELIHFEAKAKGKKPSAKQHEVMASLNHLGQLAVWADSLAMFQTIYYQYFPSERPVV